MTLLPPGTNKGRLLMYFLNLLVSFHYFVVIYINSTYLATFVSAQTLSLFYLSGSILSVILFSFFAKAVRRFGNYHLALAFMSLEVLALVGMATAHTLTLIVASFVLYLTVSPIIYLSLDIFLEKLTTVEGTTGSVRGTFLTAQNITQVVSPLLVSLFLYNNGYSQIYFISIGFLLSAIVLVAISFRRFTDSHYVSRTLWQSLSYVVKHPLLSKVFVSQVLLRFFYAWMVVYTPLYLSQQLGFSWSEIGVMFSIMLLPFLLLELPLGKIADSRLGEREIMVFGFLVLACAVTVIPFINTPTFIVWTAVLFISRVGAACVDISSESYFFKHVDSSLADTISLFRMARPATYVAATAVAALTLQIIPLQWSFLVLAVIMMFGALRSLALRDTK